jgi:hypothetical protein
MDLVPPRRGHHEKRVTVAPICAQPFFTSRLLTSMGRPLWSVNAPLWTESRGIGSGRRETGSPGQEGLGELGRRAGKPGVGDELRELGDADPVEFE